MSQTNKFSTLTVDLIRHGEPVGGKRYRGYQDDPLSELGWRQMHQTIGNHAVWDCIVTSPLSRCAAFAQALADKIRCPIQTEERLKEIGFGDWEGKTAATIESEDPQALFNFWQDPVQYRPPNAELITEFDQRVKTALGDLQGQYSGQHLLVVTHAGVIRMVLKQVLKMSVQNIFSIQVPNAGITRVTFHQQAGETWPSLIFHAGSL